MTIDTNNTLRADIHRELSDEEVDRASIEDLRAAYRSLRAHHAAEKEALISRRDDLSLRRDMLLARSQEVLVQNQKLVERAGEIMRRDEELIDQLAAENARLSEIIDFMQNHYSPIGGRSCALCVHDEGRFVRACAMHRWDDVAAKVLAHRVTDLEDPATIDCLSDEKLTAWADRVGLYDEAMEGSYLREIVDELRDRRSAEALFAEVDRQFMAVDCQVCDDEGADNCHEHKLLVRQWSSARAALCDLARVHRGYLLSLNAPGGGDPR